MVDGLPASPFLLLRRLLTLHLRRYYLRRRSTHNTTLHTDSVADTDLSRC